MAPDGMIANQRLFSFLGGPVGAWSVVEIRGVRGPLLASVDRLDIVQGSAPAAAADEGGWSLRGVTSNIRYTTRAEQGALASVQAGLGRSEARCAALIPIRKTSAWWDLPQDERDQQPAPVPLVVERGRAAAVEPGVQDDVVRHVVHVVSDVLERLLPLPGRRIQQRCGHQ
jgi:hypothetical protein